MTVRPKLGDIREGDLLLADGGFTCIDAGTVRTAERDEDGNLFVKCRRGRHNLDGQLNGEGEYVGFTIVDGA